MSLKRNILLVSFLVVATGLGTVIYLIPGISDLLTKTFTAEYGTFQVTDDADFYIVREETVYLAAVTGNVNYYLAQNEMVRKGAKILEIQEGTGPGENLGAYDEMRERLGTGLAIQGDYQAEFGGVLSYYVDGLESLFSPETMEALSYGMIPVPLPEPVNLVRETTWMQEPLYKICRNDQWYLMTWVNSGRVAKYEPGKTVTVYLPKGELRATVSNIYPEGENWKVILSTNRFYEDFSMKRKIGATVLTSDYRGIVLPNESIAKEGERLGVYVINKRQEKVFTPIKVLATDGEMSCIAVESYMDEDGKKVNTVDIYDTIVRKPN
jgi:putative membrane fusion protein